MHFLIQTKSWSSAWNRLSTVSKLNQVISQRVLSSKQLSLFYIFPGNNTFQACRHEVHLESYSLSTTASSIYRCAPEFSWFVHYWR